MPISSGEAWVAFARAMAGWGQDYTWGQQQGDQPYAGYPKQPRGHWGGQNQHDRRERRGRRDRDNRFPPAAHNPYEVRLPQHIESIATCEDDDRKTSIIMVDTRDERIVSPFQAWLVREIMTNSSSSTNVLTERDQVMTPSSGYHLSRFANYTLDGIKATLAISVDSTTGVPCGDWSAQTAKALAHEAFQPFSWPVLRDTSPSYTDIKVHNSNEILFHWILQGYRANSDLSVQQQFADELFIRDVCRGRVRLFVVVAAFAGWKCSVCSFECGGRTYSVGPQSVVIAGDHARSRFELHVLLCHSKGHGNRQQRVRTLPCRRRLSLQFATVTVPRWSPERSLPRPSRFSAGSGLRPER